jgi:nicotinate-nucleotide--dimethylbenzimidazole phosphoribosyltransferase
MIEPEKVAAHLDLLAKPKGSLGRLEDLAVRLGSIQGTLAPETKPRRLLVFAGDHGVVNDGVGIWPQAVTGAMIGVIAAGRASCSALAAAFDVSVTLVDVGSAVSETPAGGVYQDRRVARGTAGLAQGPAMTPDQFWKAWLAGQAAVADARADGVRVLGFGEIGIGNTTAAAALIALGCEQDSDPLVGAGAGSTAETLERKRAVVRAAVARSRALIEDDPVAAMAGIAGFEIVAMAGAIAAAGDGDLPVARGGVVSGAAAIVAQAVDPAALETAIASHVSAEPAHRIALDRLGLEPYLDWGLRLGEGTGALLMMPLLDAAAALLKNVAKLDEVTAGAGST